jgi:acetyltransferase-like isoleucine patch superfamily enzyme
MKSILSPEAGDLLATKLAATADPCRGLRNIGESPFPAHVEPRAAIHELDSVLLPGVHHSPLASTVERRNLIGLTLNSLGTRLASLAALACRRGPHRSHEPDLDEEGVTLGAISFAKDARGTMVQGQKRHPTIADEVTIYANATILGGETRIGRGAVMGSDVWLHESVAPWSIVT